MMLGIKERTEFARRMTELQTKCRMAHESNFSTKILGELCGLLEGLVTDGILSEAELHDRVDELEESVKGLTEKSAQPQLESSLTRSALRDRILRLDKSMRKLWKEEVVVDNPTYNQRLFCDVVLELCSILEDGFGLKENADDIRRSNEKRRTRDMPPQSSTAGLGPISFLDSRIRHSLEHPHDVEWLRIRNGQVRVYPDRDVICDSQRKNPRGRRQTAGSDQEWSRP